MAAQTHHPWYLYAPKPWTQFRTVPWKRLWLLLTAVFLLFSVIGFHTSLLQKGNAPYAVVIAIAAFSGCNAVLWIIVLSRLTTPFLIGLVALQFFIGPITVWLGRWTMNTFHLQPVPTDAGIHFAANSILFVVIASYVFFVAYIRSQGKEAFRLRNELDLAHGIQKTLVPPIGLRTAQFEIYGITRPSEQVGGDLVDALCLPDGDMVAYVADVAGHGLPAGILMGMLKTAARTALLDVSAGNPSETLPTLLERLNRVLPDVKEPQMYATLTGFRLNADGGVFYALAASPPFLHWSAARAVRRLEESQFPLGLLPVSGFTGNSLTMEPGDLIVVATDGVLEVCNREEKEFGVELVEEAIAKNALKPLPELGQAILDSAKRFGKQMDDQTLLLIRRL